MTAPFLKRGGDGRSQTSAGDAGVAGRVENIFQGVQGLGEGDQGALDSGTKGIWKKRAV